MSVRSKQLALAVSGTAGTAASTVYTVPSGHRTIVKSVVYTAVGGATGVQAMSTLVSGTSVYVSRVSQAPTYVIEDEIWCVLEAGQDLRWERVIAAGGYMGIIVSGAELLVPV